MQAARGVSRWIRAREGAQDGPWRIEWEIDGFRPVGRVRVGGEDGALSLPSSLSLSLVQVSIPWNPLSLQRIQTVPVQSTIRAILLSVSFSGSWPCRFVAPRDIKADSHRRAGNSVDATLVGQR